MTQSSKMHKITKFSKINLHQKETEMKCKYICYIGLICLLRASLKTHNKYVFELRDSKDDLVSRIENKAKKTIEIVPSHFYIWAERTL